MGTILLILVVVFLVMILSPFVRFFRAVRDSRSRMEDAMRRAAEQASAEGTRQSRGYNKDVAEDAHFEEVAGTGAGNAGASSAASKAVDDEPLIEDAKYEEIN